jgi:arylsulfatase A-like enzyme
LQTVAEKKIDLSEAERLSAQAVAGVQGIYHTFTRTQILSGNLPDWEWTQSVSNGFHPRLSGEVMVFEEPNWYFGTGTGTGHNSPWVYDTHVPLVIRGVGIQPGRYMRRVTTMDLAPTLSQLLGIEYPSGCMGKPLAEAISKH